MSLKVRMAGSAVVSLLLLAGCGGTNPPGTAEHVASGQAATDNASAFPNQGELDEIASKVRQLGEGQFVAVYAGLAINLQDDRVDVWAKDSATFRAAIDAMPWGARVRLYLAPYAAAELEPTFQRILQDQDYWRQQGLPIVQSGVRQDGSCIEVGTPDPQRAEHKIAQRYAGVALCFSAQADTGNPWQEERS